MKCKQTSHHSEAAQAGEADLDRSARDALLAALNELLEAERAGARVALASMASAARPDYAELMRAVRKDEAHWCAMLSRQIRQHGGAASRKTGSFHAKAVAIIDPLERLDFLNRGQSWVVRKLEALLQQVCDDGLYTDLCAMLDSHKINIDKTDAFIRSGR